MAGKKIDIMKKAAEVAVDSIEDEESLILLSKFSSTFELMTDQGPLFCTKENKTKLKQKIIGLNFDSSQQASNAINLSFALKECFESKTIAPQASDLPRSIVIFSNGNLVNQTSVEALLTAPQRTFDCRVSAVAIGSGAADSFLKTVALKGQGIVEVLGVQEHIDERMENFMHRLVKPTYRNVRFEDLDESVVQILPLITPNTSYLKGTSFEIFAYLKNCEDGEHKPTAIVMHYLDDENKKEKKINIMFNSKTGKLNHDLYNICINELISSKADLEALSQDSSIKSFCGDDWSIKLAKQNNILTSETSFLAVALDTPPLFFLGDDESVFDEIEEEGFVADRKIIAKQMIAEDYLSAKKTTEPGLSKAVNSKTFNARNFGLKVGDMKTKLDATASTFYTMGSRGGVGTDLSDQHSHTTFDETGEKPQSIMSQILFEENPDERDIFKRALSIFHNKMRLPSFSEDDDNDDFKGGVKPFLSIVPSPRNAGPGRDDSSKESEGSFELDRGEGMQAGDDKVDTCQEIISLQQEKGNWKSDQDLLKLIASTMEKVSKAVTSTKLDPTLVITLACIQYLTKHYEKDERALESIKKAKAYVLSTKKIPAAQLPLALKKVSEIVFPK